MYRIMTRLYTKGTNPKKAPVYTYGQYYKSLWRANRKAFYLDNLTGITAWIEDADEQKEST